MPFEKGVSGNPNGRPKGARNKHQADREISQAVAAGSSFKEIIELLTERAFDEKVSEVQREKYLKMLIDLKMKLAQEELKTLGKDSPKQPKKADKPVVKSSVESFPTPKIKRSS